MDQIQLDNGINGAEAAQPHRGNRICRGGGTWDHGGLWDRAEPRAVNKLGFKILIFLACNWGPEHQAGKNPFPNLLTPGNQTQLKLIPISFRCSQVIEELAPMADCGTWKPVLAVSQF